MRFIVLVALMVFGWAGFAPAMICFVPPRMDAEPPQFSLADPILRETGVPDGETTLMAFGEIAPAYKEPLLHELFYPVLEQAMREESQGGLETSDTRIEFTYESHFKFSGLVLRSGSWQAVEREWVGTRIIISGEGGYSTWLPSGEAERFWQLEVGRSEGSWLLTPRWCGGSFTPAEGEAEASMAELASCLPSGSCLD
ncbi:MAG TPA: hypothetical protein EYG79_14795 [Rhodobacteraceae bacterium]|nr:hypothetical protein [Paracoccaceae bacterium]